MPLGQRCSYSSDCCSDNCWGGRCLPDQPVLGERCDSTPNCQGQVNFCDPTSLVCTDRWCFGSLQTPYKGCCILSVTTCTFLDGGACIMGNQSSPTDPLCCSGTRTGNLCDFARIYDP
jgi:hypothetical protein